MPWIYKYVDTEDNVVKYVGLVYRDERIALYNRLHDHLNDFNNNNRWLPYNTRSFKIFVLSPDVVKTKSDAEILEGHFICKYETYKYMNDKKWDWGLCSFIADDLCHWIDADEIFKDFDDCRLKETREFLNTPKKSWLNRVEKKKILLCQLLNEKAECEKSIGCLQKELGHDAEELEQWNIDDLKRQLRIKKRKESRSAKSSV